MKKGIVMERHRNYTILMTKDGLFEKGIIQAKDSIIGEETTYEPYIEKKSSFSAVRRKPSVKILTLACVLALVMLPFLLSTSQHKAYAYVTIDINPSLEIEIDNNLKVNKVQPLNEDAAVLLENLKALEGKGIQKVLDTIIHSTETGGMVNPDKNMVVGISYFEAKGEIFPDGLEKYLANLNDWQVATLVIPEKIREQAHYDNISMNKLMAKKTEELLPERILDKNDIEILNTFYNEETSSEETTVPVPATAKEETKEQEEPSAADKRKESIDVEEGNDANGNDGSSEQQKKPAEKQPPAEKQAQVKQPEEKQKSESGKRDKVQEQKKEAKEQRKEKEEKRQGPQKKEKTTESSNKQRKPGQEKKDKNHPGKQHETHSKQREKPVHPSNNGEGHGPDKKEKNNHEEDNNGKQKENDNKQHGNSGNGSRDHEG